VAWLVLAVACGGVRDHERKGDEAYGAARYAEALAEYRRAMGGRSEARVLAKVGAAALHTGDLKQAADAYLRLAGEDPTRAPEAAEGLEAVARAAERANDPGTLQEVVVGLQAIDPDRALGRYAMLLARHPGTQGADLIALLPGAIAAAPDAGTVDSLLTVYGAALEQTTGCSQALLQFRAALRRSQDSTVRDKARTGVAECALALGLKARSAGRGDDAALWFAEAARADSSSLFGRRALVAYGDERLRQGDTLAAALAFQAAVSSRPDSVSRVATQRLTALGTTRPPDDSGRTTLR
jgi:tetratricopeptide (TPR) repeat protein